MSALSPQAYGFVNRIRSLHNLDRDDVSFLASGQWVQFRNDPVKFLICANDDTAAAICAAVEARQPAKMSGGGLSRLRAWIWEQREKHDEDLVALSPAFDLILNKIDEFDDLPAHWLTYMLARFPLGTHFTIEHDGFGGAVCGYYCRSDGKLGVNLQLDRAKVVHVYGEKWLGGGNG
jgi:hypothetical protein